MQAPSLSLRSTSVRRFSGSKIEETVLENLCSNLLHLEAHSCLHLLHLICMFLVFLTTCCNRSSLKPARPMRDGRPFASPPFRRLAGRGSLFRGFTFRWALQFAFSLTRCLTLQDTTPYSGEDTLYECGRPCDKLSCLFFTALWLRQSQSTLVQDIQPAKDIDLTCYKTLPIKSVTCLQVEPMSLEWPVALNAGSDQSSPSSSHGELQDEHPKDALPAPPHSRWRRDALQPLQLQRDSLDRNTRVHIPDGGLRCVTWNTRGLIGSVSTSQISRELKLNYFKRLVENNNVICLQEVHGKDEFLQAIQVWAPRFS